MSIVHLSLWYSYRLFVPQAVEMQFLGCGTNATSIAVIQAKRITALQLQYKLQPEGGVYPGPTATEASTADHSVAKVATARLIVSHRYHNMGSSPISLDQAALFKSYIWRETGQSFSAVPRVKANDGKTVNCKCLNQAERNGLKREGKGIAALSGHWIQGFLVLCDQSHNVN